MREAERLSAISALALATSCGSSDGSSSGGVVTRVPVPSVCGNGIPESGEACDDGNTDSNDSCSSDCKQEIICGDGIVAGGEQCDTEAFCDVATCTFIGSVRLDSATEMKDVSDEQALAMCMWLRQEVGPSRTVYCNGVRWNLTVTDCSSPGTLLTRGTVVGCHMTVGQYVECIWNLAKDPCFLSSPQPQCRDLEQCHYAEPGSPCSVNAECLSGVCDGGVCRGALGEGQPCSNSFECASGLNCCANSSTSSDRYCGAPQSVCF